MGLDNREKDASHGTDGLSWRAGGWMGEMAGRGGWVPWEKAASHGTDGPSWRTGGWVGEIAGRGGRVKW